MIRLITLLGAGGLLLTRPALAQQPATVTPPDTLHLQQVLDGPNPGLVLPGKLAVRKVLGGRARLLLPVDFQPLDRAALEVKYPRDDRPQEVYSDAAISVNLAFQQKPVALTQAQITPALAEQLLTSIRRGFPTAKDYGHGVKTINGRKVAYLEVLTQATDTKVYNLMFVTDVNGRAAIATFNCTEDQVKRWQPVARQMLNPLQVP
ncbi:hypothetical protein EJV47_22620 [Hymenobacter gummosus]|uniref:DUF1795 domain-containing protein n=1 Tax=Hymenobacter gummosus TaxID=1776032 RepID=A0A3S0J6Z8_9BACT|nr:hypothetical protein [Hymenobacter gummosus]RTQ46322.1 hypothetical protein EJV47_22620 [Hymenobacter gummosus]